MEDMIVQQSNHTKEVQVEKRHDYIVSDEVLAQLSFINFVILTGSISSLGVVFNIINIIVFIQLGFKDPLNISLLGLAIADTGSLLPMIWISICNNPLLAQQYSHLNFQGIQHLTAGWPHVCFSRISSLLTAFITLERHLCVALPLKIKSIITPRRRINIVVSIFIISTVGVIPTYFGAGLGPTLNWATNMTTIGLVYYTNGQNIENAAIMFSTFTQLLAFVVVTISTLGLVQTLQQKSKWRQTTSSSSNNTSISNRDQKTVKLVVIISVIFIASYLPISMSLLGMLSYGEFTMVGMYRNLLLAFATVFFCLESFNASVNIFVYLIMSSKYRNKFMSIFNRGKLLKQ
ncbi:unnamed protein product [Candidula unifasciata]|uniref:G-protein coupled receptors family 1 profile domain-containing protein n=1 Tax=Candidula unifasciata TaxID=100452 RepID=A0A8S3YIY5_9EUPU|nr:unnamed protein product [Candidula unifasciata]